MNYNEWHLLNSESMMWACILWLLTQDRHHLRNSMNKNRRRLLQENIMVDRTAKSQDRRCHLWDEETCVFTFTVEGNAWTDF